MRQLVELRIDSETTMFVEAEGHGVPKMGGTDPVIDGGELDKALGGIQKATRKIVAIFREVEDPKEMEVEFALAFNTKANAFFLSSGMNTSFKVTMRWKA
jgi:Trypsin-co-occurring domain 1